MVASSLHVALQRLEDLETLARRLDISAPAGRLEHTRRIVRGLLAASALDRAHEYSLEVGQAQMLSAVTEATEIALLFPGLLSLPDSVLRDRLPLVLDGPPFTWQETPVSNRSRNTVFELNLLGRLALHGAVIEQHPLVDVAARVDGDLYFFQCKRPFADGKVEKLVKKAYHQLERDLATVNNAWGVIAVSLSRLINPGTFVFLGRSETPFRDLSRELEPYDSRLSSLHKQCRHPRVLGVVLHFITPGVVLPSSTPIHIEQRGRAHSFHPFDAALHARFWRLTQHLTDRIVEA